MAVRDMKQKSVNVHDFSMQPKNDVPRSSFKIRHEHKTTMDFSYLIPILCEEVLPGDTWNCHLTSVIRTAIPIVPVMDNWYVEYFSFFVPNRILWTNWVKFMGEQDTPGDSISYTIPQIVSPAGGFAVNSIYDYFGLPTVGQVGGASTVTVNALPLRAWNKIYNKWFRDENLCNPEPEFMTDGPDGAGNYALDKRGKRFDYFTQALPWPQKGNTAVSLPLGTAAPVRPLSTTSTPFFSTTTAGGGASTTLNTTAGTTNVFMSGNSVNTVPLRWASTLATDSGLYADLSAATAATINQLRQAFTIQELLEKDARGGTRYTEIVRAHFGVISPDARLQRPEYIGGGRMPIMLNAVPQTAQTGLTGGTTPLGTLGASGSAQGNTGFTYNSTEHGYIITVASARAEITYQQGLRKMWSRSTRYDFYFPVFAALGEQAVLNKEIYIVGTPAQDDAVFGYVPRWDEYRHSPSKVTAFFRSTSATPIDYWHSAQKFTALPTLNATFIQDDARTVLQRNFAAGALSANQQLLCDFLFEMTVARPLPMYGIPGMMDRF